MKAAASALAIRADALYAAEEYGPLCAVCEGRNARHYGRVGWTVRTLESACLPGLAAVSRGRMPKAVMTE